MGLSGWDWIEALPDELAGQQKLLRGLLTFSEAHDYIRWLVIGCSLSRGAGDRFSDLDMGMGVNDDDFAAAVPRVHRAVDALSDLVESYSHKIPAVTGEHERIFAQYADRCQVDLVVFPASTQIGAAPNLLVLYDPGRRVEITADRTPVTTQQIRERAFGSWCALADLGKYMRRKSTWEALDRLNEARSQFLQLLAAVMDVPDSQYGLTSILDFAPDVLPPELEVTVADLDAGRITRAARELARQLTELGLGMPDETQAVLPTAMGEFITADLEQLPA